MQLKEKIKKLSGKFVYNEDTPVKNLRKNLDLCISQSDITIKEIATECDVSIDTIKNLLYQSNRDCRLATAVSIANGLGVSVDELVGTAILSEENRQCIYMFRNLPEHYQYFVRWFIHRQYELSKEKFRLAKKTIPVMELDEYEDGTLHMSTRFHTMDITDIEPQVKPQIFMGIDVCVDYYMPRYSPYDTLLIANDRNPKPNEHSVIIYGDNVFIAKRSTFQIDGDYIYYSIRDEKPRCKESEISSVVGYIAKVKTNVRAIADRL